MQKKKGISLIVLVITIVVMIIIAGTTISVMIGENSILNQAKKAKLESDLSQLKESSELVKTTGLTEYYSGEKTKYDKEDLLNDLNNNFEGSILSTDKITTSDGQYDIIVDNNLNIVVVQSNSQGSLSVTPKIVEAGGETVVSLRFSVPGEITVVDYVLDYIDTKLYKEKSIAEMETEFLALISGSSEEGTTPTMTDEIREEIFNYGKILGATTYEQTLKAILLVVSMQSSENQYETFGILGEMAYPYAAKYIGLEEYTTQTDLKNQLVSVAEVDSFETYLTTEFGGATESDITTMLAENNVEYEDFLRFLILKEAVMGSTEEEQAELLEPYMMEIKVSNGTTTETIPTLSLLGVHPYPVTESGVYTFEITTMDGATTSFEVSVEVVAPVEPETPVEPEEPTEPEFDATFANNTWSEIITAVQNNTVPSTWAIGDTKTMTINGTEYNIQIIGKNHDTYSDGSGTAPLTFQLVELYAETVRMNNVNNSKIDWADTLVRTSTLPGILATMPSEVQSAIREVNKLTMSKGRTSLITTADKLFLFSRMEVFGTSGASGLIEGSQYAYYANGGSAKKYLNGNVEYWWLRARDYYSGETFECVSNTGSMGGSIANRYNGISFGFCF